MASTHRADWQRNVFAPTRRTVLQALAGTALTASLFASLESGVEAGKKQKKRRKKKRKNKSPATPTPIVRPDAACGAPPSNAFVFSEFIRPAQTFTAGATGTIPHVDVHLALTGEQGGEFFLRVSPLLDGVPADIALATARLDDRDIPTADGLVRFTFNQPPAVTAGTSYALVLARTGEGSFVWRGADDSACAGRAFFALGPSAPFERFEDVDFLYATFIQS